MFGDLNYFGLVSLVLSYKFIGSSLVANKERDNNIHIYNNQEKITRKITRGKITAITAKTESKRVEEAQINRTKRETHQKTLKEEEINNEGKEHAEEKHIRGIGIRKINCKV